MKSLLIKNGTLVCLSEDAPVFIENGGILIEGGLIKRMGKSSELERDYRGETVDARGGIVMPGLINCHTHLYSALARGISIKGEPASNFVQILEKLWWRLDRVLDKDSIYYSALVGIADCLRFGTTTIFDHHASNGYVRGSLDLIAQAVRNFGIRASLCYEVSDRDGKKVSDDGIEENLEFIQKAQSDKSDKIKALFGLHASFTISEETFKKIAEITKDIACGFHIHCAEDWADQEETTRKYGLRVVDRLEKYGILRPGSIVAHCIHISGDEIKKLAQSGVFVAHNPESNMNNGVGAAPVLELIGAGAKLGLGTDGYSANMFAELRVANILPKLVKRDPRVGWAEAFRMLFTENPRFASTFFEHPVGVLKENAYADLIILPYNPPTPMNASNVQGHCIFGFSYLIPEVVIVGGEVVLRDGKFFGVDEYEIDSVARREAEKLWRRFNNE